MVDSDQVWVPGKAYEILLKAPFNKATDTTSKSATRALAKGERRNKGRGYRVLVTLNNKKSCFLAEYLHTYMGSSAYTSLGTADALSIRTLTDRLDEMCAPSEAQVARQARSAKGREVAAVNRDAAREPKLDEAKRAVQEFRDWCQRDAFITQQRNEGNMMAREPMPVVPSTVYKMITEYAPTWKAQDNHAETVADLVLKLQTLLRNDSEYHLTTEEVS